MLASLREQKKLSQADVAERLKLPAYKVAALESGDYHLLPDMVFVRGFLRAYGRLVQADNEAFSRLLDKAAQVAEKNIFADYKETSKQNYAYLEEKKSFPGWLIAVFAAAVAVGGVYVWQSKSASQQAEGNKMGLSETEKAMDKPAELKQTNVKVVPMAEEKTVSAASSAGTASATAASAVAASGTAVLPVVASDELYIKPRYRTKLVVKDKNGAELVNQIVAAGSEHRFKGNAPYDVRIGVVQGSMVNFGGKEIDWAPSLVGRTTAAFKAGQ